MTSILVARHGQSEWNAAGRWQGQADPPLSDLGRAQARLAAERVGAVDVIVASDLQRATETAAIIAAALGVGPVVVDVDLRERDAGEWSGLTRAEIERDWPGYLAEERKPPGFEPGDAFRARTRAALDRVHADFEGADVLVVSHGGVIYGIEADHGLPHERIANLGARHVHHAGDRLRLGERIQLVEEDDLRTLPGQL